MNYRIGADTGGTFTDVSLVAEDTGEVFITKVPSTPDNSAIGVMNGVRQILSENAVSSKNISFFIHGSTVATNTLLEKKGAKTALITTKGFKDILEIGRQTRPKLYEFRARRPEPLIPRDLRWELDERTSADGETLKKISDAGLNDLFDMIETSGVESIVICFINAFINAENEHEIKTILEDKYADLSVTISSDILPEIKEYERTSTVAVNGYVMPKLKYYLRELEQSLNDLGTSTELYIMQSNGGVITTDTAVENPVRTVLSGPAGGVVSGTDIARQTGLDQLITIDMGGTSLDSALIDKGEAQYTTNSTINDFPINVPMVDMHTIGSGGGSIAWIDTGGALRVGPQSAGADPGPVCYGKGGEVPTVSDANAILGRLNPDSILGGRMKMDIDGARGAVEEKIAKPLGLSVEEAAEGILKVVNANMVRGIRVISVEKGHDTRDFSLLAFGGAGPLHAVDIAQELECRNIVVPPNPGITCAEGMLIADVRHDYVRAFISNTEAVEMEQLNQTFSQIENEAVETLKSQGFEKEKRALEKSIDLRYSGQAYELNVELGDGPVTETALEDAITEFHKIHEKIYGFKRVGEILEIVNVRLTSFGIIDKPESEIKEKVQQKAPEFTTRDVYYHGGFKETKIIQRSDIPRDYAVNGPAIIEQLDSTIVIFPNQEAYTDAYGNLIIENINQLDQGGVQYG